MRQFVANLLHEVFNLQKDAFEKVSHNGPQSPFTQIQAIQNEQREGWAAETNPPPPVVPLEEARALAKALENLRDEQNGPPLERHKDRWQAAYDNASQILADFEIKHPTTK